MLYFLWTILVSDWYTEINKPQGQVIDKIVAFQSLK